MSGLREALARLEHEQWAAWAQSILDSEDIGPLRAARWHRLIATDYDDLTEPEKDADRVWADKIIARLKEGDGVVQGWAFADEVWDPDDPYVTVYRSRTHPFLVEDVDEAMEPVIPVTLMPGEEV